jgi:benzoyl-CoA reductase/2-hydroxyglutaryl-CoA dehydratase subunit BcrC/BadD/HgdB
MSQAQQRPKIAFACAYAPLPLIHAAGFEAYRVLPTGDSPDAAGSCLHDNLCPHVKRILDRALADDLPDLAGVVLVNSCDAMRRLADAWRSARPTDRVALLDLPITDDERSVGFLSAELQDLAETLGTWSGQAISGQALVDSAARYNQLAKGLAELANNARKHKGGQTAFQKEAAASVTTSLESSIQRVEGLLKDEPAEAAPAGVPILLFGNVLPDPEALAIFETAGCQIAVDDLCTGSRQITNLALDDPNCAYEQLARAILLKPACARTFRPDQPGWLAEQVLTQAKQAGAQGVVAHVMKFCDPYLSRLPIVRRRLREAGLPLLVLEGDCSLRSMGQHRTRIEAFAEMLEG